MKKNKAHHKAESRHKFISSGVRRTTSTIFSCICTFSLMYSLDATADPENRTVHVELKNSTQGPLWPPGELMEENGSFIVVGSLLQDVGGGVVLVPDQTDDATVLDLQEDATGHHAGPTHGGASGFSGSCSTC